MANKPLLDFDRDVVWQNKHQTQTARPDRLYTVTNRWANGAGPPPATRFVAGAQGLRQIVLDAETAGRRVRAVGGGWSLSRVATTGDYLVNTRLLNYVNIGLKPQNVAAEFDGDPAHLVFTQCGATIMELNRELESRGLSLPTSGASNGQTICGATSTGTHGSNRSVGAMHQFVVGIHVIAEHGAGYFIERKSRPVVTDAFCAQLGATPRRDDELFRAAVVGLGSFGLIHGLLLLVVPIFSLERYVRRFDFARVEPVLSTLDVGPLQLAKEGVPDHFEVVINPHGTKRGQRGAAVRYMYQSPTPPPPAQGHGGVSTTFGDDVMSLFGHVTTAVPGLVSVIAAHALDTFKEGGPSVGSLGQTFGSTSTEGFVMSCEIGVALGNASAAVDAILQVAGTQPWPGLVALRYVKWSRSHMAFTRFSPITCTIELPSAGSPATQRAFEMIWDELERRRIPYTLHWGQQLRYDAARVKAAFGVRATRWLAARRAFLSESARRTFSNSLIEEAGLGG
jgi:hypothetical protein